MSQHQGEKVQRPSEAAGDGRADDTPCPSHMESLCHNVSEKPVECSKYKDAASPHPRPCVRECSPSHLCLCWTCLMLPHWKLDLHSGEVSVTGQGGVDAMVSQGQVDQSITLSYLPERPSHISITAKEEKKWFAITAIFERWCRWGDCRCPLTSKEERNRAALFLWECACAHELCCSWTTLLRPASSTQQARVRPVDGRHLRHHQSEQRGRTGAWEKPSHGWN